MTSLILKPRPLGSTQRDDLKIIFNMSSFNAFRVVIIMSHKVNNDSAALALAYFSRSHLVLNTLIVLEPRIIKIYLTIAQLSSGIEI